MLRSFENAATARISVIKAFPVMIAIAEQPIRMPFVPLILHARPIFSTKIPVVKRVSQAYHEIGLIPLDHIIEDRKRLPKRLVIMGMDISKAAASNTPSRRPPSLPSYFYASPTRCHSPPIIQ